MNIIKILSFILAFSFLGIGVSSAQMGCGDYNEMVERLEKKYGETRRDIGLSDNGRNQALFEWFANDAESTWTILRTTTFVDEEGNIKKTACLMAVGSIYIHVDGHKDALIEGDKQPIKFTPGF